MGSQGHQRSLALPSTISEAQSLARSLENWRINDTLPRGVTLDRIDAAIQLVDATAKPCPVEAYAVIIDELFTFARTFEVKGIDPEKIENAAKTYRKTLVDLPPDLLQKAIDRVIADHRFGSRLPLPREIRDKVAEELNERAKTLHRLQWAREHGKEEPAERGPRTPEEIARAEQVVRMVKANLKATPDP